MKKHNLLKGKHKYRVGEPLISPINTAENCANCECGEISRELTEFAAEHTPEKTIRDYKG
ncbi:hypothetical protein V6C27_04025 [Peptococcaceae bacterium 1198_IL3148]